MSLDILDMSLDILDMSLDMSLNSRVQLHINLLNVVVRIIFPHFCKSDMSRYGYLKVFQRVHWNSR